MASLGVSAVWFCHGGRRHCGVLCDCRRGLVLLLSAVAGWFPPLTSWPLGYLTRYAEWPVLFSLGVPPPLLSSISTLSALQVSVVVPSGSLLHYRVESSRCGPPFRVESVSVLDRDEGSSSAFLVFGWSLCVEVALTGRVSWFSIGTTTLSAPSLGVGAVPSRWGHPYRIVWRLSAHSIGTKAASIHSCFAMGSPYGSSVVFSRSVTTKSSLVIWSVFLQDGVTIFGYGSDDLISSEGIPTVGLLGEFFRPVLGGVFLSSFGWPVGSEAGRVPHSVVFASSEVSVCVPLANEGVGLGPSSGPVAPRPPLAVRSASATSSPSGGGYRSG